MLTPKGSKEGRIIVVDDEAAQVKALCDTLCEHCEHIDGFTSGKDALKAMHNSHYDLLLSDLMMPELDGIALLQEAREIDPDLVVIIMTGAGSIASAVDSMKAGAFEYIQKPFKLSSILPVLSRAMAVRRLSLDNRELALRVQERTAETLRQKEVIEAAHLELSDAYTRLQEAQSQLVQQEIMASLGRLVAGVAHEANTPLGSILLSSNIIRNSLDDVTSALQRGALHKSDLEGCLAIIRESAEVIERASTKAANLVTNFKQLATIQSAGNRCQIDVASLLESIGKAMGAALRAANVELLIDVDHGVELIGNPGHFEQVVVNLINNAILHGFEGRSGGCIAVSAKVAGNGFRLAFSDDGVGIPQAMLKKIFQPFFTTKFGKGGSGLGLYLVYNIVTASLFGKISVESEPGKGTTFILELPQAHAIAMTGADRTEE